MLAQARTLVALAVALGAPLHAARAATPETVARDPGARMERLADGVYAIIHDDATHDFPTGATEWPHGNTGVVVGDDGVLVVDATYTPSRARADIALIRAVTRLPVRYLVNTHWHGDHTHGNAAYRQAFPNVVVLGATANRDFIALNQARYPHNATAPESRQRKALAQLVALQASGKDSTGRVLTAVERARLDTVIREHQTELQELAAVVVAPPTLGFEGTLTLFLGSRRVELRDEGRANSPHDVTVYLPTERVLYTGDVVVHPIPYAWQSHPVPWLDVLRRLESVPVAALVPGHGPVMHDQAYTRQVRELLEATTTRVAAAIRQGMSADDVQRTVRLDDLRDRFVNPREPGSSDAWQSSIQTALVERSWACLVGYRC